LGPLFPKRPWDLYIEPFFGGGAVFFHLVSSLLFHLGPTRAVLIDKNEELINFYRVLRDNVEELLVDLRRHEMTPQYFKRIRALKPEQLTPVQRASRYYYLRKMSYGGKGQSFAWYTDHRKLVNEPNLRLVSRALARAEILLGDFSLALNYAGPGTFIYLDPPYYLPENARNSLYSLDGSINTRYGFNERDHIRVADVFRQLDRRGCLLMLSNSDTLFIRNLYPGYDIHVIDAKYSIKRLRRLRIRELVIRNYRD